MRLLQSFCGAHPSNKACLSSSLLPAIKLIAQAHNVYNCKRKVVKRSNKTSEQREERLAADRKRAALKVSNESSKDRQKRLRAVRERAAAKRAHETSQEKGLRLRARRE